MRPILEKVGAEFEGKGIKIIKLDVDDNKPLANLLLVNEMPLLLFYVDGKLAETMIGFTPEPVLLESVKKYLN
jgi:thiol-disulfide isomerase/thioredoxin